MQLTDKLIKKIVSKIIDKNVPNKDMIVDCITKCLSSSDLETTINVIIDEDYVPLKQDDIYLIKITKEITDAEHDIASDLGISVDNCLYAKIIKQDTWMSSAEFNPFYYKMKCKLVTHDEDKKIIIKEISVYSYSLKPIDQSSVPNIVKECFYYE